MKRRTLFTISPHHTDIMQAKASLSDTDAAQLQALTAFIHEKIGVFDELIEYQYRITNMNYAKLRIIGHQVNESGENVPTEFYLALVIAGYTEFPSLAVQTATRFSMCVTDATDTFWLVEILRHDLTALSAKNASLHSVADTK